MYHLPPKEDPQWDNLVPPITLRQRALIRHLADGCSNNEAARNCHISRRQFYKEMDELRLLHNCRTNLALVIKVRDVMLKINAQ